MNVGFGGYVERQAMVLALPSLHSSRIPRTNRLQLGGHTHKMENSFFEMSLSHYCNQKKSIVVNLEFLETLLLFCDEKVEDDLNVKI